MLQINLLPPTEKEKIFSKRTGSYVNSLVVPIIILVVIVAGSLFLLSQYLVSVNRSLDSKVQDQSSEKQQYAQVEEQINEFNQISGLVSQLSQYKVDWPTILADLASQTPQNLQISKFYIDSKNNNQLKISGAADSYRTVMLFKEKLEASKQFKNPSFGKGDITEGGAVNFELSTEFETAKIPASAEQKQMQEKEQE